MVRQINNFDEVITALKTMNMIMPNGLIEEADINGLKISLVKSNEGVTLKVTYSSDNIDTEDVKEVISDYKEALDELDDNVFIDVVEELSKHVDMKRFNDLLEAKSFTDDEAKEVINMIDLSTKIIQESLQSKIDNLESILDRF